MAKSTKGTHTIEKEGLVIEINQGSTLDSSKFDVKYNEISDWFNSVHTGIKTPFEEKNNIPKGNWIKCDHCQEIFPKEEFVANKSVCSNCGKHYHFSSKEYMELLFDDAKFKLLFEKVAPVDILQFKDTQSYKDRLAHAHKKTNLKDALQVGVGEIGKNKAVIAGMDFEFIGGSLGCVVGEKFCRGVEYAIKQKSPFIAICQSGGARMMESAYSLMQMPKTLASLHLLAEAKLPYIVILTDPTYGGVTASFAMVGDIHIAEPNARIGFAGQRVIKDLIKQELPEDFQTSESLQRHGFIDKIVSRLEMKQELAKILALLK